MAKKSIYDQHAAAFARVGAYVLINRGLEKVATIHFKHPADGAGRLYCYLHITGIPMVRGYGYDKKTSALLAAVKKAIMVKLASWQKREDYVQQFQFAAQLYDILTEDDGLSFEDAIRKAGFTLIQAL